MKQLTKILMVVTSLLLLSCSKDKNKPAEEPAPAAQTQTTPTPTTTPNPTTTPTPTAPTTPTFAPTDSTHTKSGYYELQGPPTRKDANGWQMYVYAPMPGMRIDSIICSFTRRGGEYHAVHVSKNLQTNIYSAPQMSYNTYNSYISLVHHNISYPDFITVIAPADQGPHGVTCKSLGVFITKL